MLCCVAADGDGHAGSDGGIHQHERYQLSRTHRISNYPDPDEAGQGDGQGYG